MNSTCPVIVLVTMIGLGCGQPNQRRPQQMLRADQPLDPLVQSLGDDELATEYRTIAEELELAPRDSAARLNQIAVMFEVGCAYNNRGDSELAMDAFQSSVEMAEALFTDEVMIPPGSGRVLSLIYYNGACLASRAGQLQKAIELLNTAARWGFRDYAHLENDRDLDAVRELPQFAESLRMWKEAPEIDFSIDSYEMPLPDVNASTLSH